MHTFIFATNNTNKVNEIRSVLANRFQLISLKEAGIDIDIPEPHHTLKENASEKSSTIHKLTGKDCFSEDTGLEVLALNGAPGVKSARYAGEENDNKKNIALLLSNMEGIENRQAQFRTIVSLIQSGQEYFFEGVCKGVITLEEKGEKGFGYDAVFIPEGSDKAFAEMDMEQKNKFSHRKKAISKLIDFLNSENEQD